MNRPHTALFMIQSLDGKISTGDVDTLDVDLDFKRIKGVREGVNQYYDLEKLADPFSLNTGRVMAKIGVNDRSTQPEKIGCSFVIIDSKPHLTAKGTEYVAQWVKRLFLVTSNHDHPAFDLRETYPNIEVMYYENDIDLADVLRKLHDEYAIERLTIQSGGTINAAWIRSSLIDQVSIVIAPCLIGGTHTQSLIGGESLHTQEDLIKIRSLKLVHCNVLENNYIHVLYDVDNEPEVHTI